MNLSEMIDAKLGELHPCTCDELSRGLGGDHPPCVYHEVVGDGAAIVSHLIDYGHLPPDANTRPAELTARQCRFAERATAFCRQLESEEAGAPA